MSIDIRKWREFAGGNAPDFARTAFVPGLVTDPERVGRLVDDSLRTATRRAPGDLRLRAFRPGAFDYALTKRFVESPLKDGESAVEWLARTADSAEACLAVNDVSSWNLALAEWADTLVRELLAAGLGELPSGTDVYSFVADSGWTPFGIHKDHEPSLIFHLGPSPKEVWVWSDGSFDADRLTPNPSFGRITFDIEPHLASAERFLLRPGDFLCIPKDTYHVFRNLGPSAFVGMTLYPTKSRSVITEALWRAAGAPAYPLAQDATGRSLADGALALLGGADRHPVPLAERVRREVALGQLKLRTNGYLSRPHKAVLPAAAPEDAPLLRWSRPGAVAAVDTDDTTTLVARGRTIPVPVRADFGPLQEATHSEHRFSLGDLAAALPSVLDAGQRRELAENLYRAGAVTAV